MDLNGAHLNHFVYQNRGDGVRPSQVAQSLYAPRSTGRAPRMAEAEAGQSLEQTFANEIARRASAYTDQDGNPRDTSALTAGLADAMGHLRDQYGREVAEAAEAMVMGGTAGGITEKNLGDSLTNVLRMVDRNFGAAAGDATIARFNGALNHSINEFFDNGQTEQFLAVEPGQGLGQSAVRNDLTARVLAETTSNEQAASGGMQQLLDSLRNDLDEQLEENLPGNGASMQDTPAGRNGRQSRALNSYAAASGVLADAGPQMLSMNV
ncbi:MAG: hypothetical protein PHX58_09935 [Desulfovibrio sp.]|nr:hypothetical protein [Desulfovibrio sp.]